MRSIRMVLIHVGPQVVLEPAVLLRDGGRQSRPAGGRHRGRPRASRRRPPRSAMPVVSIRSVTRTLIKPRSATVLTRRGSGLRPSPCAHGGAARRTGAPDSARASVVQEPRGQAVVDVVVVVGDLVDEIDQLRLRAAAARAGLVLAKLRCVGDGDRPRSASRSPRALPTSG